jgi:uncharacterized membrane protein YhaH (DUF805 family)
LNPFYSVLYSVFKELHNEHSDRRHHRRRHHGQWHCTGVLVLALFAVVSFWIALALTRKRFRS